MVLGNFKKVGMVFAIYIAGLFGVESDFTFPSAGPFGSRQGRLIFKVGIRRDEMESVGGGWKICIIIGRVRWDARVGARRCPSSLK